MQIADNLRFAICNLQSPLEGALEAEVASKSDSGLSGLETTLGYAFRDRRLLVRSLSHSSSTQEAAGSDGALSNENLEFLGDSILGFIVSEVLMRLYPQYSEGQLSKLKSHLVSASHLYPAAQRLDLGRYLRLGKGEERSGGRSKKALLVDAFEALIAAIYLDGGIEPARAFVNRCILDAVDEEQIEDYKSELQELLQGRHGPQPRYVVIRERGPEHSKVFTVQLRIAGERIAEAEGDSKKAAEQAAARIALEKLKENSFGFEG